MPSSSSHVLARILQWFRAGYPAAAPREGYVPLLALEHHILTDEDIQQIARRVIDAATRHSRPVAVTDLVDAVRKHALRVAADDEVAKVEQLLCTLGWRVVPIPDRGPDQATSLTMSRLASWRSRLGRAR